MASFDELVIRFVLNACVGCRACSDACPSCRNDGTDPQKNVSAVLSGTAPADVWKCLVCHRCSMECPQDIDVAGMMLALREMDSNEGGTPETIRRSHKAFRSDGKLSLPKGRGEALRKELGLSEVVRDQNVVDELNAIMKGAGVRDE